MKTNILSLLVLFTLLVSGVVNAQYYGNGGMDRRISGQTGDFKPKKNDKPVDYVQISVDNLTKNLNLDGFQSAIVKTIIEDFKDKTVAISMEEIPNEGKDEKMRIEKEKMETKILDVLNKEQKITFQELKDKSGKKDKKKKKENKEESETEGK